MMDLVQRFTLLSYEPGSRYYATNRPVYFLLSCFMELSLSGGLDENPDGLLSAKPGMAFSCPYLQSVYALMLIPPAKKLTGWLDHYTRRLTLKALRQELTSVLAALGVDPKEGVPEDRRQAQARQLLEEASHPDERSKILLALVFGSGLNQTLFGKSARAPFIDFASQVQDPICRKIALGTKYWNGYAGGILAN